MSTEKLQAMVAQMSETIQLLKSRLAHKAEQEHKLVEEIVRLRKLVALYESDD